MARRESAAAKNGGGQALSGAEGASAAEESSVAIDMLQVGANWEGVRSYDWYNVV